MTAERPRAVPPRPVTPILALVRVLVRLACRVTVQQRLSRNSQAGVARRPSVTVREVRALIVGGVGGVVARVAGRRRVRGAVAVGTKKPETPRPVVPGGGGPHRRRGPVPRRHDRLFTPERHGTDRHAGPPQLCKTQAERHRERSI